MGPPRHVLNSSAFDMKLRESFPIRLMDTFATILIAVRFLKYTEREVEPTE